VERARKIFFITQFNPSFGKTLIAHCGGFKACNGYGDYLFRFFDWLGTVDRLILDVLGIGEHSGFAGNKYKGNANKCDALIYKGRLLNLLTLSAYGLPANKKRHPVRRHLFDF
jgi:hypothetical protein